MPVCPFGPFCIRIGRELLEVLVAEWLRPTVPPVRVGALCVVVWVDLFELDRAGVDPACLVLAGADLVGVVLGGVARFWCVAVRFGGLDFWAP